MLKKLILTCTLLISSTQITQCATPPHMSQPVDFTTSCSIAGGLLLLLQQRQDMILKNPGYMNLNVAPTSYTFSTPLLLVASGLLFAAAVVTPMQQYAQDTYDSPKEVNCRNFAAKVGALCGLIIASGTFAVDYLGMKVPFLASAQ